MSKLRHESIKPIIEPAQAIETGQSRPVGSEFDDDGIPIIRPVSDWLDLAEHDGLSGPSGTRWLQAVLRFSRPDGSPVFGPIGRSNDRLKSLEAWANRLGDGSLRSVVARWRPSRSTDALATTPSPLPSDSRPDRPLAILRNDWDVRGDLVAIDHRQPGGTTLLEVTSRGKTWLGNTWTSPLIEGKTGPALPTHWTSTNYAHVVEWSSKVGAARLTRLAALLRGRSMALLGQQLDGAGPINEVRLALPDGVDASPLEGSRALLLAAGRGHPTARLIPLGLPAHTRPTDRGSITIEGREVVIRQVSEGRRNWLPVLICWGKAPTTWRPLTVAYRSKATREDTAVAVRVAWGRLDDGLVVYRSLASPALRCFLGHQTGARFLVGAFHSSGDVRPILKVDR